ncbi:MAG: BrnT family toxin [Bifidobacteriaceae bacterium]|nr:BrnT family toxin [Bifidobacteriaceae bacterium]
MFEWDPDKSASNKAKHGIDFEQAKALWDDPDGALRRLEYKAEPRWALTAMMGGRLWFAVWAPRGATIRIISVRRATRREVRRYGAQAQ